MNIELKDISKRYTRHWILRNIDYTFASNEQYAVLGANGSGKSTLLKMIAGYLSPSAGEILYTDGSEKVKRSDIYKHVSFSAPYVSPLYDLSIAEMLQFYERFKSLRKGLTTDDFIDALQLPVAPSHIIKELSSGQQQRVSLTLAILADTDILLLDEPGSYLDEKSKIWMNELIGQHLDDRITIIASNDRTDLVHTQEILQIEDYH